jgi:hypothetical protein
MAFVDGRMVHDADAWLSRFLNDRRVEERLQLAIALGDKTD